MEIQKLKISEEERKLVSDFIGEDIGSEIDFNRLMPVVKKIEGIGYEFTIHAYYSEIWLRTYDGEGDTQMAYQDNLKNKLLNTIDCVIQFIEWYNGINKEQSVKVSDTTKAT